MNDTRVVTSIFIYLFLGRGRRTPRGPTTPFTRPDPLGKSPTVVLGVKTLTEEVP